MGCTKLHTLAEIRSRSHFANNTIFIGETSLDNARTMRRILKNMELASGLKVNFEKCRLIGVNVSESKLRDMA